MTLTGPVVFWNLERLFASAGSPISAALGNGAHPPASAAEVDLKVRILGAVLADLNAAHGRPALVGLAEVETPELVAAVVAASGLPLQTVEGSVGDDLGVSLEGLDTSLLYDPGVFDPPTLLRSHVIDREFDTRDVLEVHLPEKATGRSVCVLVNHWPSRLSLESLDRRVAAAFYVRRLILDVVRYQNAELWDPQARQLVIPALDALRERADRPVVVMGDFNDEPFDRSLELLGGTSDLSVVTADLRVLGTTVRSQYTSYVGSSLRLYNPAWALCNGEYGTYYRSPRWRTYDQILLSRGALGYWPSPSVSLFRPRTTTIAGEAGPLEVVLQTRGGRPLGYDARKRIGASDHVPLVLSAGS